MGRAAHLLASPALVQAPTRPRVSLRPRRCPDSESGPDPNPGSPPGRCPISNPPPTPAHFRTAPRTRRRRLPLLEAPTQPWASPLTAPRYRCPDPRPDTNTDPLPRPARPATADRNDAPLTCQTALVTARIATVQAEAVPAAVEVNVARAARFVIESDAAGADVVLFPEAFLTGYDETVFAGALPSIADRAWLAPQQEAVDETGVAAVVNTALQAGDRRTLTDLLFTPGQPPYPAYSKQHLHSPERAFFTSGARGYSFRIRDVEFALSVCYDANFPEHAAAAAAAGATVYLNSGAYFPGGGRRRDLHLAARALDNGIYVVYSGLVGVPSDFIGGSAIFDPLGRRIAAVGEREGLAIADIDPAVVEDVRRDQRMWADRRDDLGAFERSGELRSQAGRAAPA